MIQRDERDAAVLRIRGAISGDPSRVEARLVVMPGGTGKQTAWVELPLPRVFGGGALNGRVPVFAGGWYALEVRAWKGSALLAQARVEKIGVGEILVIAGQSNAANSGSTRLRPAEDRVSTWNRRGWSWAGDPQPLATGREGSPWPRLGDLLVRRLQVPVGIVSVAVGGSPIHEWLYWATWRKHGECYVKFREALRAPLRSGAGSRGPRAVLWHQGETDVEIGTSTEVYARKLAKVIAQSRRDAGFDIPWLIAGASYIGRGSPENEAAIRAGQRAVCDGKLTFEGAVTDELRVGYRSDAVHFNEKGLKEHARLWFEAIINTVLKESTASHLVSVKLD